MHLHSWLFFRCHVSFRGVYVFFFLCSMPGLAKFSRAEISFHVPPASLLFVHFVNGGVNFDMSTPQKNLRVRPSKKMMGKEDDPPVLLGLSRPIFRGELLNFSGVYFSTWTYRLDYRNRIDVKYFNHFNLTY